MLVEIQKARFREQAFFFSYGIYMIFAILRNSFYYRYFSEIYKFIILFCCMLLVAQEVVDADISGKAWISKRIRISQKSVAGFLICILLFFIVYSGSQGMSQKSVAVTFLYIYSSRKIDFEKIAGFTIVLSAATLAFVIFSSYVGIIDNYLYVYAGGSRSRHLLGFRWALYAPTIFYNISAVWVYLKQKTAKLWQIGAMLLIALFLYVQTDSRSIAALTVLILLIPFGLKFADRIDEKVGYRLRYGRILDSVWSLGIPIFVVLSIVSVLLGITYNPSVSWMAEVNAALDGRLALSQNAIMEYGIHWLSQNIEMVGSGFDAYGNRKIKVYTYIDSFYVQTLVHYGIIFTIIFLAAVTCAMIRFYRKKRYVLMFFFILMAVHFMTDDLQMNLYANTFWLILGSELMKTEGIHKGERRFKRFADRAIIYIRKKVDRWLSKNP